MSTVKIAFWLDGHPETEVIVDTHNTPSEWRSATSTDRWKFLLTELAPRVLKIRVVEE